MGLSAMRDESGDLVPLHAEVWHFDNDEVCPSGLVSPASLGPSHLNPVAPVLRKCVFSAEETRPERFGHLPKDTQLAGG